MKEPEKNVDNRIQYVGQIASEGKHSNSVQSEEFRVQLSAQNKKCSETRKKPKSRNKPSDKQQAREKAIKEAEKTGTGMADPET